MHLSLIGMSNIGKTFCAKNLAAHHGFKHIDCDALIEQRLGTDLTDKGHAGLHGIAQWMGFPSDPGYSTNSTCYLDHEKAVMHEALDFMRTHKNIPTVLDTTGSVIYAPEAILNDLKATTRIVYFEASEQQTNSLLRHYLNRPKPVIWGEHYQPQDHETPEETITRCYPELLKARAVRYREIADVIVPFNQIQNHWTTIGNFVLDYIGP